MSDREQSYAALLQWFSSAYNRPEWADRFSHYMHEDGPAHAQVLVDEMRRTFHPTRVEYVVNQFGINRTYLGI